MVSKFHCSVLICIRFPFLPLLDFFFLEERVDLEARGNSLGPQLFCQTKRGLSARLQTLFPTLSKWGSHT